MGKARVQKLMQRHGIRAKGKRRFEAATDSAMICRLHPMCSTSVTVSEPDKVWGDGVRTSQTSSTWNGTR